MEFPELLYTPQPSEVAKAVLQPRRLVFNGTTSVAASSLSVSWANPVPTGQVYRIDRIALRLVPGAGQNVTISRVDALLQPSGLTIARVAEDRTAGAANITVVFQTNCNIFLLPSESLVAFGFFNAGALANSLEYSVWGWILPIGSIQHGST